MYEMKKNTFTTIIGALALLAVLLLILCVGNNAKKSTEIETLTAALNEKSGEVETLNEKIAGLDSQIEQMTNDTAEKDSRIEALTSEAAEKDSQIEALTSEAAEKDSQIEALTSEAAEKDGQIEKLTSDTVEKDGRIEALEAEIDSRLTETETLSADMENKLIEIENLKENSASLTEQIDALTAEIENRAAETEQLSADAEEKSEEIEALRAEVEEKQQEIEILNDRITSFEGNNGNAPAVPENYPGKYDATKYFLQAMSEDGIQYSYSEDKNGDDRITSVWTLSNLSATVNVYISDNNRVSFRIWNLIDCAEENILDVMVRCNYINSEYKYVNFFLDNSDNSVTVKQDLLFSDAQEAGAAGYRMFNLMLDIADECDDLLAPFAK